MKVQIDTGPVPFWATPSSKRTCGSCSLCCKVMDVKKDPDPNDPHPLDLAPIGSWCPHSILPSPATGGCGIHTDPDKPKVCGSYSCAWLDGVGLDGDTPKRAGIVTNLWTRKGADGVEKGRYWVIHEDVKGTTKSNPIAKRWLATLRATLELVAVRYRMETPTFYWPGEGPHDLDPTDQVAMKRVLEEFPGMFRHVDAMYGEGEESQIRFIEKEPSP